MSDLSFKTPEELQALLGERLRSVRLARNIDQRAVAEKAGVSEKALRNLEAGRGSSVDTLVRVLKALDYLQGIDLLAPQATVNPLALLRTVKPQRRVRRPHRLRSAHPETDTQSNSQASKSEAGHTRSNITPPNTGSTR